MKRYLTILGLCAPMVLMAFIAFRAARRHSEPPARMPEVGPDGKPVVRLTQPTQDGGTFVYRASSTNGSVWTVNGKVPASR